MAKTQNAGGFVYYQHLLEKSPHNFLALLDRNLIDGGDDGEAAGMQLDVIAREDAAAELMCSHRNEDGDTLAHTAATFHRRPGILTRIFHLSPGLLTEARKDDFEGQTPLHIVISKGNRKMARAILEHPHCQENLQAILSAEAIGSKFEYTIMMGQLPLSVAALTFDRKMVALLLKHGADIGWKNKAKDTVLHSLIRFAGVHSDKIHQVLEMMTFINGQLTRHGRDIWHWARNNENLTPLKLAASLGLVEVFTAILNLDGVYRSLNAHDGLFDIHLYDITEIDTVTQAEWERYKGSLKTISRREEQEASKSCSWLHSFKNHAKKKSWKDAEHWPALLHKAPAVLDIICRLPVRQAFDFIYVDAVKELIKRKWEHYKWLFALWAIYHLLVMVHITAFAIYKTKIINSRLYTQNDPSKIEEAFVYVTAGLLLLYAAVYLTQELVRTLYFKQRWHLRLIQHNGLYRLMMVTFSLGLIVDAVWFYIRPHNNYFLIVALIIGWTFMAFFLRTWKRFSFYTVMFQKVLLGDMTRLSVIILFQLVAFSIAIYTVFLNTQPAPSGFQNAGMAIMTMFKLMLGLTDIEVFHDAREPWLAILLYVLFVLVTYVLLINSLIAMMSRTCDLMSQDRNRQWEFQRLSVILLLETMLLPPWRFLHKTGIKAIRRYGLRSHEFRCYIEITSIQTTYREGRSVLQRKSMIDTIGFGQDRGTSIWSPFFSQTDGNNGGYIQNPFDTIFQSTSLCPAIDECSASGEDEDEAEGADTLDYDENEIDDDDENEFTKIDGHLTSGEYRGKGNFYLSSHDFEQILKEKTLQKTESQHRQHRQPVTITADKGGRCRSPFSSAERKRYQRVLLANALLRQRLHNLMTSNGGSRARQFQMQGQQHSIKKCSERNDEFGKGTYTSQPRCKTTKTVVETDQGGNLIENATSGDLIASGAATQLDSKSLHQITVQGRQRRIQPQGENSGAAGGLASVKFRGENLTMDPLQCNNEKDETHYDVHESNIPFWAEVTKHKASRKIILPPVKVNESILDSQGKNNDHNIPPHTEQPQTHRQHTHHIRQRALLTEQAVFGVVVAPSSERQGTEIVQSSLEENKWSSMSSHEKSQEEEPTQGVTANECIPRMQDIDISFLDSIA